MSALVPQSDFVGLEAATHVFNDEADVARYLEALAGLVR